MNSARLPSTAAAILALFLAIPALAEPKPDADPSRPLGEKGALVFSDDFSTDRFGAVWKEVIKSAGVENGVMFVRQTTREHGGVTVARLDLPDGNLIFACRVQFEHNATVGFEFDDMKYRDSVAGHIARVTLEEQLVKLHDDKEGAMNRKLLDQRKSDDPTTKANAEAEMKRRTLAVPMKVEKQAWHTVTIEIVADRMRLTLDDKPIGVLTSTGLAHATKPDLKISVSGKQALFDDIKVWTVKTKN